MHSIYLFLHTNRDEAMVLQVAKYVCCMYLSQTFLEVFNVLDIYLHTKYSRRQDQLRN